MKRSPPEKPRKMKTSVMQGTTHGANSLANILRTMNTSTEDEVVGSAAGSGDWDTNDGARTPTPEETTHYFGTPVKKRIGGKRVTWSDCLVAEKFYCAQRNCRPGARSNSILQAQQLAAVPAARAHHNITNTSRPHKSRHRNTIPIPAPSFSPGYGSY